MKSRFQIVELGKYVRQVSQRNRADADIEVFSVTNSEGFTKSTDYFSKEVFSKDVSNYKVVSPGQFAYNPSRINVGSIDCLRYGSPVLVSPLYIVFEGNKDIHADYLLRYLKCDWGNAQIRANTEGAVRDSLKFKGLENIKLPLPLLDDQIRIAYLLGKVEGLIAQRKQHLQQLDDLLKSVFLEMFGDTDGWPSRTLSSIAVDGKGTFSNGPFGSDLLTSELTDTGVPVIYIRDIRDARYERVSTVCVTEEKAQELGACLVQPGDVLIAKVGDPPGTTAIYPKGEPIGVITQDVIRLRPNTDIVNAEFVTSFLNSHIGCQLIREITVEATRARFGLRELKMQEIPVPPMDLQNQFAAIVEKIESIKSRYQQSLTDLEDLYGALSQQAFKGELDLSRVPLPRQADETPDQTEQENLEPTAPALYQLPEPEASDWLSVENRPKLFKFWLNAWCERYAEESLTASRFLDAASQRLVELTERDAFQFDKPGKGFDEAKWYEEPAPFGINEYEQVKEWVFDALASGRLTQGFDDADNCIELKAAQA